MTDPIRAHLVHLLGKPNPAVLDMFYALRAVLDADPGEEIRRVIAEALGMTG